MRKVILLTLVTICWSCGGGQSRSNVSNAPSAGGEKNPFEKEALPEKPIGNAPLSGQAVEPAEQPAETGPASVTFQVTVNGQPVEAKIKISDAAGNVVGEGKAKNKIAIQSGRYEATVSITDKNILADKPSQTIDVDLAAGQDARQQVSFPWAKIKIFVQTKGKVDYSAQIDMMRNGAVVATLKSGDKNYTQISPGRYQAEVNTKKSKVSIDNLLVPDGATQDIPVDVQF